MRKKILYFLLAILILISLAGIWGVRWFNNMWFKDRPVYLSVSLDSDPIDFQWSKASYDNYVEMHSALMIPVRIEGITNQLYFQFDTGAPSTVIYGNTLASLQQRGLKVNKIKKDDQPFVESLHPIFGDRNISMSTIELMEGYGPSFELTDTSSAIVIGSIGADFLVDRITVIDFKNQYLQFYNERPNWMTSIKDFKPFDFQGRRFMLPAIIKGKDMELFYDSGCSSFGLLTSKDRYDQNTDKEVEEIRYEGRRWGDDLSIFHKPTDRTIDIGNDRLPLRRISYVGMYAKFQKFMTPFTRIGGWLGNMPFIERTLILDTQKEEFVVIESSVEL